MVFVKEINKRIEQVLEKLGGEQYTKISERNINSIDLEIYSAYKAQETIIENIVIIFFNYKVC